MPEPDYPLRLRAQTLMAEGKLPRTMPARTVAGFGSGRPCVLCDDLIFSTEPEVELHFNARTREAHLFHRPCYVIWLTERMRAN